GAAVARSLAFPSDPLPEPLLIADRPEADLQVSLPADDETNLVARVSVVGPDERSALITSGWLRVPPAGRGTGRDAGGDGLSDDVGDDAGVDVAALRRKITVPLGAAAFEVPAGSR